MSFADYLENELLDHVLKVGAYTQPTNICVGLSTADPGDDGSGLAEPSGNNYSRVTHNTWNAAAGGAATNDGAISFPNPSGSWGTVTHVCLFDAASGGNLLMSGALDSSKSIGSGDTVQFADEALTVSLN